MRKIAHLSGALKGKMGNQISIVKNRTSKNVEFTYSGQVFIVPAREEVAMLAEVAAHGIRKSTISYNIANGTAVKALCLADSPDADAEIEPRVPGSELIERDEDEEVELKTFSNPDMRGARITSPLED